MCTISFIPGQNGFLLGMNRDELRTRPGALPPQLHESRERLAVYPSEPGGGTWIGMNNSGLCLALINWHSPRAKQVNQTVSRGIVVKQLIQLDAREDLAGFLSELPLESMPAFRLVAIGSREHSVSEFQWDQRRVVTIGHGWVSRHWFSSGIDEKLVETERVEVCRRAWREPEAGKLSWLRRLHRSHEPYRGRLSICMHGQEANTVSYAEAVFCGATGTMRYHPGPLCDEESRFTEQTFPLASTKRLR